MVLIEVHLAPGSKEQFQLSKEVLRDTKCQVMTSAEAAKAGFNGLPATPPDREVRWISVAEKDSRWILSALESNPHVTGFRAHDLG